VAKDVTTLLAAKGVLMKREVHCLAFKHQVVMARNVLLGVICSELKNTVTSGRNVVRWEQIG